MAKRIDELSGAELDFWVAKACGYDAEIRVDDKGEFCRRFERMKGGSHCIGPFFPSSQWVDGGPVIEREAIGTFKTWDGVWMAAMTGPAKFVDFKFPSATPLEAAMRCFVASKFGDEVRRPRILDERQTMPAMRRVAGLLPGPERPMPLRAVYRQHDRPLLVCGV